MPAIQFTSPDQLTGVGFKSNYLSDILAQKTDLGWLEIHAENYMMAGGPRKKMMQELAERFPISCHGVGLSIGSEDGLDTAHLNRLAELMNWLNPAMFSEHLAWSSHSAGYFNDLLPLPYTNEVLERVVQHINQIQERFGREMLLENPSTYLHFAESEMTEIEFIHAITKRTGCKLLLDINNVFVSANNQKLNPYEYVDAYPMDRVGEIHLGGHDEDVDEFGETVLIDSHNNPVAHPVWALYAHAIERHGLRPTLIEWDNDLPEWSVLQSELLAVQDVMSKVQKASHVA